MTDDRSVTQRTLDTLQNEWTKPYREALERAAQALAEASTELDALGEARASRYAHDQAEAAWEMATGGGRPCPS